MTVWDIISIAMSIGALGAAIFTLRAVRAEEEYQRRRRAQVADHYSRPSAPLVFAYEPPIGGLVDECAACDCRACIMAGPHERHDGHPASEVAA